MDEFSGLTLEELRSVEVMFSTCFRVYTQEDNEVSTEQHDCYAGLSLAWRGRPGGYQDFWAFQVLQVYPLWCSMGTPCTFAVTPGDLQTRQLLPLTGRSL